MTDWFACRAAISAVFSSYCAVVRQHEQCWTWLTCRESVWFAVAFFHHGLHGVALTQATDELLAKAGILSCADVMCGSDAIEEMATFKGLSGGQIRRLSLAIALAKKPAVLIADEPTSGLDSAAAAAIVMLLGELARDTHMAVVATIHQPSPAVFAGLDELLLLSKGCTVYAGAASNLAGYLGTIGKPLPSGISVAEHALDLVNADFTSDVEVDAIIEAWSVSKASSSLKLLRDQPMLPTVVQRATMSRQLGLLFQRHAMILLMRDPLAVIVMLVLSAVDISVISLYLFNELRRGDQNSVLPVVVVMLASVATPTLYFMLAAVRAGIEQRRVGRELANDMYHWLPHTLIDILIQAFIAILFATVSALMLYVWSADVFYWPSIYAATGACVPVQTLID